MIRSGPTQPLAGEPRPIAGVGRERLVYASAAGIFQALLDIGETVRTGDLVATIDGCPIRAPIGGIVRGITRDGVPVTLGTKVFEVDPRGPDAVVCGLGERPRRLAEAVRDALG